MARHSHLPPAQRVDLVLAVLRGTEKLEVLARRHQVSANTLRRWRDEFVAAGRDRLTGQGDAAAAATAPATRAAFTRVASADPTGLSLAFTHEVLLPFRGSRVSARMFYAAERPWLAATLMKLVNNPG